MKVARVICWFTALNLVTPALALDPVTRIIPQTDAPLRIVSYSSSFQERGRYTTEGISHSVEFQNVSDRPIAALQIGLTSFDVWNEFLDRTGGIVIRDLPPGAKDQGAWLANAYGDFSFHTGVAYVARVRFGDGDIWICNLQGIADELKKIEKDFDIAKLKGKPEKP